MNVMYKVCIKYQCRVLTSISCIRVFVSCVCNVRISMISMNVYNKYDDKYIHFITNQVSVTMVTMKDEYEYKGFPKVELQYELAINRKYRNARHYSLPSFRKFRPEI